MSGEIWMTTVECNNTPMAESLVAPMQNTDHREVGGVHLDIGKAAGCRIKRVIYPAGFRWSIHMKPVVNTEYCMHAHAGFLAQGRVHIQYGDGDVVELAAWCGQVD